MIVWSEGTVAEIGSAWSGAQVVVAEQSDGRRCRALVYTDLMPTPRIGDRLLLNVAALDRGLGTGGYAMVVALLDAAGGLRGASTPPAGHLVKARYTPLQTMVAGADEQGSPFHDALAGADDLAGLPVVVADLHSALAPIVAAIHHDHRQRAPGADPLRVVYLMTDHGALPLAFSRTVAQLNEAGQLAGTVTVGQAYGGDLEAVNVHSGLLAARIALNADLVVLTQGPGNLGTDTRWGFSGVAAGEAINAAAVLGGRPIGTLRISGADARFRHRGLSHHSLTAYGRVALRSADIAVPDLAGATGLTDVSGPTELEATAGLAGAVEQDLGELQQHRLHRVELNGLGRALLDSPVPMSTMGRSLAQDPAYFLASAAAGRLAVQLLRTPIPATGSGSAG